MLNTSLDCTSVTSLFDGFPSSWNTHLKQLATISIIHVFHTIWMARNGIHFNNTAINSHAAKMKILTAITTSAPLLSVSEASDT
jgi:hypothetical protein